MIVNELTPDLVMLRGKIYTMDGRRSVVPALAARGGRIVAMGRDAEIEALAGPQTRQLDLQGRAAIPGVFDSHNHLLEVGAKLSTIRLDECRSVEEMELVNLLCRLADHAEGRG